MKVEPLSAVAGARVEGVDLSQPLTVFYVIGGKAKQGLDYNPIGTGITIKAGTWLRRVEVTPFDDGANEANEAVTMTLQADDRFTIAPNGEAATIRIISAENTPTPPPPPHGFSGQLWCVWQRTRRCRGRRW